MTDKNSTLIESILNCKPDRIIQHMPTGIITIINPPNFTLNKKIKKEKKDCNPGFNCRRVGFYCSNIN